MTATSQHQKLLAAFDTAFGGAPTAVARAPGRVNLIGEHTDYNDGFVLPCAIDFGTLVAARARSDRRVRLLALDQGEALDEFSLDDPITPRGEDAAWANYVRGMVQALLQAGYSLVGADLAITGDVPQGAGLSSSAALEVSVGQAFKQLAGLNDLDATTLALLAQRAENEFVGCRCGIMDQLISARGQAGKALLIDCRSLEGTAVAMPADMAVLIVDSKIQRGLVGSEYNLRREQCEAAARHFGVKALRDIDLATLASGAGGLDATAFRRARHVVTENVRTLAAAQALATSDWQQLSELMAASHASMRDDFEITTPAIDGLVEIIRSAIGTHGGVRMTGGGFGGCVVALTSQALAEAAMAAVAERYRSPAGHAAVSYLCTASAGAGPWAMPA
ncbi:galactokinase [Roseateles sp.]|uniref:galactokinase n=1 Tax=Roseateles sp. TaxID=1971397 RepID=UPI0032640D68